MKKVKLFESFIFESNDAIANSFIKLFYKSKSSHGLDRKMDYLMYKERFGEIIMGTIDGKPNAKLNADLQAFAIQNGFDLTLKSEEDLGFGEYSYAYSIEEIQQESGVVDMAFQRKMARKYEKWERGLIHAWGGTLYLSYYNNIPKSGKTQSLNQLKRDVIEFMSLEVGSDEWYETDEWFAEGGYRGGVPLFTKDLLEDIYRKIAKKTPAPFDFIIRRTSDKEEDGLNSYTTIKGGYARNGGKEMAYLIPKGTPIIFAGVDADESEIIWIPTKADLKKYRIA